MKRSEQFLESSLLKEFHACLEDLMEEGKEVVKFIKKYDAAPLLPQLDYLYKQIIAFAENPKQVTVI